MPSFVVVILYDRRLDTWAPGAHIGTFRGNQLAFAAGAETARIFRRDDVLANVRARGEEIGARLLAAADRHPFVLEARGLGLMWGIELCDGANATASELARAVQRQALEDGLILEVGGRGDTVIRLLPPLNLTPEVAETACDILDRALEVAAEAAG